jgi:hypothetical protein
VKKIIIFFLFSFTTPCFSEDHPKSTSLDEATINIPEKWNVKKNNNCLIIKAEHVYASDYLKLCRNVSNEESDYFTMNDNGKWEAVTDGIPVLANIKTSSKFTGMSAVVSCKYKDDTGYHSEQCFQAEIKLPQKVNFIFTGRGNPSLFSDYNKVYLSFMIK